MARLPAVLFGPHHIHAGVNTRDGYLAFQGERIAKLRDKYPHLGISAPWRTDAKPAVGVSGGKILIECATEGCRNCPSVSFEWGGLACCLDCGAIYEGLEPPERWAEIEAALIVRPARERRHWDPNPPNGEPVKTVEDLVNENSAHGWGQPAAEPGA